MNNNIIHNNSVTLADDAFIQTLKNLLELIQGMVSRNHDLEYICTIIKDAEKIHIAKITASGTDVTEKIIMQIRHNTILSLSLAYSTGVILYITASERVTGEEIDNIISAVCGLVPIEAQIVFDMNSGETIQDDLNVIIASTKK